jgi:hypothetical protein
MRFAIVFVNIQHHKCTKEIYLCYLFGFGWYHHFLHFYICDKNDAVRTEQCVPLLTKQNCELGEE